MGGVKKKIRRGRVPEKINCVDPKGNHGLKQCSINSHPSLLDSFAIKQSHTMF